MDLTSTTNFLRQNQLATVTVWKDKNNIEHMILYYCLKDKMYSIGAQVQIKNWLEQKLPHYMLPAHYIEMTEMPFLANGKIDQRALPEPVMQKWTPPRFEESIALSKLEKKLLVWWKEVLNVEHVGLHDNFFDLGGNSLGLIQINNRSFGEFGYAIPLLKFFQYPSIASFVKHVSLHPEEQTHKPPMIAGYNEAIHCQDIAIIGLSGKFPGADHLDQFWENLVTGTESITHFEKQDLLDTGIDPKILADAHYVRSKGFLENVEYFDAKFFGYTQTDADSMDPQMRIMHQCVWEALENAGYDPFRYAGSIGLFAGSSSNLLWMSSQLKDHQDFVNAFETILLNEKDFMTTRLSYKLNLKGPSVNVQTACSTSLVAIHQASQSLIHGECDMALAGGVSITFPRKEGYLWHQGLIFSKDGHCKPFSNDASGMVPGNGCGMVVLKRLADALQDGDHIYGVIKGSATNNDGINKIGFTAPSVEGQTQVIRAALEKAKIEAEQICYLEAHGTGTELGDPIEIQALKQAWATERKNYCALGSVKANIGHLDAAAGVASFIKATLILYHRTLPPLANFKQLNPEIDLANSPFYVSTTAQKIEESKRVLRVGLSSFGIGGSNAHLILEQAPLYPDQFCAETLHILPFSGHTEEAVVQTSRKLIAYLKTHPAVKICDAAWTLQMGRKSMAYRKALIVKEDLQREEHVIFSLLERLISHENKEIVFYFSADSDQEKIRQLYHAAEESALSRLFKSHFTTILSQLPEEDQARFAQREHDFTPILHFAANYALAKTCLEIGLVPKAVGGDGVGEILALTVSQVVSMETALEIMSTHLSLDQYFSAKTPAAMSAPTIALLSTLSAEERDSLLGTPMFMIFGAGHPRDQHMAEGMDHAVWSFDAHNPVYSLNICITKLWHLGHDLDWARLSQHPAKRRVPLPTYEFTKHYHNDDIVLSAMAPQQKNALRLSASDTEKRQACLRDIWSRLFGKKSIETQEDFFSLGGDSLKASILAANVQKHLGIEMPLAVVFQCATFKKMQDWLDAQPSTPTPQSIEILPKHAFYPTSSAQKRMYATQILAEQSISYNLAAVYTIEGPIEQERLKQSFDTIVQRHEVFRTRFDIKMGEVVQIIEDTVPTVLELETVAGSTMHEEILAHIRPFHLDQAPLLRVKLFSLDSLQHILLVDLHHIIADQSSIHILLRELMEVYAGKSLKPLSLQYKDFAGWQNKLFDRDALKHQVMYWQNEFKDGVPVLNMPTDYPRDKVRSYRGNRIVIHIPTLLQAKIEACAQAQGVTPFTIFMAAFKLLLWKYTGQTDFVIGTATTGRTHPDLLDMIGMFVNTLPIRSDLQAEWSMETYVHHIKEKLVGAYANQNCQFEKIVEMLDLEKEVSRNPIFDVAVNYLEIEGPRDLVLENLVLKPWHDVPVFAKFDMTWTIEKHAGHYTSDIEYASDLYAEETMQIFAKHLLHSLEGMANYPSARLSDFSLLTPQEKQEALARIHHIEKNPCVQTVLQLFSEQVEKQQDRPAVVWENQVLTYREFHQEIHKISALLRSKGAQPGERIAIMLGRSPAQIASIFAVLACGCAYVPIDPQYPNTRISLILNDCKPSFVITSSDYALSDGTVFSSYILLDKEEAFFQEIHTVFSFAPLTPGINATDAAYVMYTSGSTGKPKGVVVSHHNIIQLVKNNNFIEFLSTDRVVQISNYAFDGSVFDIFGALLNGACLILLSQEKLIEMAYLSALIQQQKISLFYIPTALFHVLVDWDVSALQNVRKIVIGGESPSPRHVRKALHYLGPDKLINAYGPTEATVFSTYYSVQALAEDAIRVPMGFPLARTKVYVLDKQRQLLPPNIIGELYIGGEGVAQGYLNHPDLTQERFIKNPFIEGELVYKTGDLVKQMPSGELIFIGREDFQVKIRGFRVELKEIEACLTKIQGIHAAIVLLQHDRQQHPYLAAYLRLDQTMQDKRSYYKPEMLKAILSKHLPEYMVPARIKIMSSFPMTSNGKIDLKALPEIDNLQHDCFPLDVAHQSTEQIILTEAQRVLDNPGLTVQDNFFEHGGHSIKAIAFTHQLKQLGIHVKVSDIFQYPTVQALCALHAAAEPFHPETALLPVPSIRLNAHQIYQILEHSKMMWKTLSHLISSGRLLTSFAFAPVQIFHAQLEQRLSGFSMSVYGPFSEDKMRQALLHLIKHHPFLHSVAQITQAMWYEYDLSDLAVLIEKTLVYLDLSQYLPVTQEEIVQGIATATLSTSYETGALPWRCSCVRLNHNKHQLIWGFDHLAFDGWSADILRSQLDKLLSSKMIEPSESYADYTDFVLQGPRNISEQDIITQFQLTQWAACQAMIAQKLKAKTQKRSDLILEIALQDQNITDPWQFTFDLVLMLLHASFGSQTLPLGIVHYGRQYQERSFHNCVGEFLDILPILSNTGSSVAELLDYGRKNGINFMALLFDPHLAQQFPQIYPLLAPAFVTKSHRMNIIGFNFQGFIAKEDRKWVMEATHHITDNSPIAEYLVVAYYDETHIHIAFPCYKKEREALLNRVKAYLTSKEAEVDYV